MTAWLILQREDITDPTAAPLARCLTPCRTFARSLGPPDVLEGDEVFVHEGLVDFGQDVVAFRHLPEHRVHSVQVVQVLPGRDQELREAIEAGR